PPPKRKRRLWLWIIGGIVALIVISAVFSKENTPQPTSSAPPTATEQLTTPFTDNTPAPTQAPPSVVKVGDTITINDVDTTLVSVKKLAGDEFTQPKPGNTFIVVHVR